MKVNKLITLQINACDSGERYEVYIEVENDEGFISIFFPSMECTSLQPFDIKETFDNLVSYNELFSKMLYKEKYFELKLSISDFAGVGCRDKIYYYMKRGKFTEEEIMRMRNGECIDEG